jgi:hypothetical protein
VSLTLVFGVLSVWLLFLAYSCSSPSADSPGFNAVEVASDAADQLGANTARCACHTGLVKERISEVHLDKGIASVHCHGLSVFARER